MRKTNQVFNDVCKRVSRVMKPPVFHLLVLGSCTGLSEANIIGEYIIDKHVIIDKASPVKKYTLLVIKGDKTFELKNSDRGDKITGVWSLINSKSYYM